MFISSKKPASANKSSMNQQPSSESVIIENKQNVLESEFDHVKDFVKVSIANAVEFISKSKDQKAKLVIQKLIDACKKQNETIDILHSKNLQLENRVIAVENRERQKTVIISGVAPVGKNAFEIAKNDEQFCKKITDHLQIPVSPIIYRLNALSSKKSDNEKGSNKSTKKPALIKMIFPEHSIARHALVNAIKLRSQKMFNGIHLNPHRTPEEQAEYNEKRKLIISLRKKNFPVVYYKKDIYISSKGKLLKYKN